MGQRGWPAFTRVAGYSVLRRRFRARLRIEAPLTPEEIASGLIQRWEGFRSRPYLCPAGVATIGFGFTHYPDGRPVTLSDPPIQLAEALRILRWLILNRYMPAVLKLCPNIDTPGRLGAMTDWCFNYGESKLRASTLRKLINAARWSSVPAELSKWVLAGGRRLPGLVARRAAEVTYI